MDGGDAGGGGVQRRKWSWGELQWVRKGCVVGMWGDNAALSF